MALIVLVRPHHGGGRPPAQHNGVREDVFSRDYVKAAEDALLSAGHRVLVVSGVERAEAFKVSKLKRADLYIECHANSGRASQPDAYGLLGYDYRSAASNGARLAGCILVELNAVLKAHAPGSTRVVAAATEPTNWTRNMFATIRGCGTAVGLCYEPVFLDALEHAPLVREPKHVGLALARGICSFLEGR